MFLEKNANNLPELVREFEFSSRSKCNFKFHIELKSLDYTELEIYIFFK